MEISTHSYQIHDTVIKILKCREVQMERSNSSRVKRLTLHKGVKAKSGQIVVLLTTVLNKGTSDCFVN